MHRVWRICLPDATHDCPRSTNAWVGLPSRVTLGGLTFPRNPLAFGGRVFHPSFVTHAGILTRCASTAGLPRRFTRASTLPYPPTRLDAQGLPCTPADA